ncbi:MAG: hypothetical protein ACLQMT_01500 [Candidatus Acidiferrales bacterium]
MLGPFDYAFWLGAFLLEVAVVLCTIYRRSFFRYLPLNIYMSCMALVNCGQYACIKKFGYDSAQYSYFYFYTDGLLMILMFLVIMHFYEQVFIEMNVGRYIRGAATLLLAATALFSYLVIHQHEGHLPEKFVVEFSQNIYFVGLVLTYLLWGAVMKLRETRAHLVQLILALGIYFSGTAGTYALQNLFPGLWAIVLHWLPGVMGAWLPAAWVYTFAKVPEEARLATAPLAVGAR